MTVYLILLAVISLIGTRLNNSGDNRYLDKEHSTSLKGIFVAIILLSHFNQYITIEQNMFNYPYLLFFERIGQLMVTPFLFFSGYGVMLSIDKKKGYLDSFLKNRVLKTLIQFDLAVALYYLMNLAMGIHYDVNPLLVLIGWDSVGNSNWYIFVLLCLYVITYLVFTILKDRKRLFQLSVLTIVSLAFIIILAQVKSDYWYDTIPAYVLGVWYYCYKDSINRVLNKYYLVVLLLSALLTAGLNILGYKGYRVTNVINSAVFCILLLAVTFKLEINNRMIGTLGNYVFEVYILQRIPYTVFGALNLNTHVYFLLSVLVLAVMAYLFRKLSRQLTNVIIC
ncbi:MAG: acyltransferase family protein [Erysipelotrichaceae bacterium]|nr:acyltransferase family protein [Erysipelotrichaceae bacterium]